MVNKAHTSGSVEGSKAIDAFLKGIENKEVSNAISANYAKAIAKNGDLANLPVGAAIEVMREFTNPSWWEFNKNRGADIGDALKARLDRDSKPGGQIERNITQQKIIDERVRGLYDQLDLLKYPIGSNERAIKEAGKDKKSAVTAPPKVDTVTPNIPAVVSAIDKRAVDNVMIKKAEKEQTAELRTNLTAQLTKKMREEVKGVLPYDYKEQIAQQVRPVVNQDLLEKATIKFNKEIEENKVLNSQRAKIYAILKEQVTSELNVGWKAAGVKPTNAAQIIAFEVQKRFEER